MQMALCALASGARVQGAWHQEMKRALSCRKVFKTCLTDLCQKLFERMKNDATRHGMCYRELFPSLSRTPSLSLLYTVCVCRQNSNLRFQTKQAESRALVFYTLLEGILIKFSNV